MSRSRISTARRDSLREFFPDADIVAFVCATYSDAMADQVAGMLAADPLSVTGFVSALRRSLTAEMERDGGNQ